MKEIWKDIPGYEGFYQVSDLGRVKSLDRQTNGGFFKSKEIKSHLIKNGYYVVRLNNNGCSKTFLLHQLVAMSFLGHIPNKHNLIIDHKNGDKSNNRLENLQIITQRENCQKRKNKIKKSSDYIGVCYSKSSNKWISRIEINKISNFLGSFDTEYEAHIAYKKALETIKLEITI